jgi:hypothetical protein
MPKKNTNLILYEVITGQYASYDGGPLALDPAEYTVDVIYVEAYTRREAKIRAVKYWHKSGTRRGEVPDENPFSGLKATPLDYKISDNEEIVRYG